MVGVIQVFRHMGETHMGSKKRRKIPRFKWGLYFSWFVFEKSCSNI